MLCMYSMKYVFGEWINEIISWFIKLDCFCLGFHWADFDTECVICK